MERGQTVLYTNEKRYISELFSTPRASPTLCIMPALNE